MSNEERNDIGYEENSMSSGSPRWVGFAVVGLTIISVVALGIGWSASSRARKDEQALAAQGRTQQASADTLAQRLSQAEGTNTQLQNELTAVTDRLKMTQGEVTTTRKQTSQIRDDYSKKIDNVQSELDTKANTDDVKSLNDDVNGVKTGLDTANNNLQMARGELGTLIARNHDEIDELRRLGERDYYEFTISGKGSKSKVGGLTLELRGTNSKKNQFSVAMYVDDMRLEKKNRSVDEPIYFYTRGTRAPLEFVVNQVAQDKIVGYMSVPKAQPAGTASAASVTN
jgi:hypothetical protein